MFDRCLSAYACRLSHTVRPPTLFAPAMSELRIGLGIGLGLGLGLGLRSRLGLGLGLGLGTLLAPVRGRVRVRGTVRDPLGTCQVTDVAADVHPLLPVKR